MKTSLLKKSLTALLILIIIICVDFFVLRSYYKNYDYARKQLNVTLNIKSLSERYFDSSINADSTRIDEKELNSPQLIISESIKTLLLGGKINLPNSEQAYFYPAPLSLKTSLKQLDSAWLSLTEANKIRAKALIEKNKLQGEINAINLRIEQVKSDTIKKTDSLKISQQERTSLLGAILLFQNDLFNKTNSFNDKVAFNESIKQEYITNYKNYESVLKHIIDNYTERVSDASFYRILIILMLLNIVVFIILFFVINEQIIKPVKHINKVASLIKTGNITQKIEYTSSDELGGIAESFNGLNDYLKKAAYFTTRIGEGDFDVEMDVADNIKVEDSEESKKQNLGYALKNMRDKLKTIAVQDDRRNWINKGLAIFADLLRANNDNLAKLADEIIGNLVKYVNANQGSFFLIEEHQNKEKFLKLIACYAYDRKKYESKEISLGEGLAGRAALEKGTIYITDVPDNYLNITSGLGQANPRNIVLIPMLYNDDIFGVIEIASFSVLKEHEVEFMEKLAGNLAATISNVKVNERTNGLLKHSQLMTEKLQAQEENMKQHIEELRAQQEETQKNHLELVGQQSALNSAAIVSEADLRGRIIYINDEFCRISGYSKEELMGKSHNIVRHPDMPSSAFENLWSTITASKVWKGRVKNRKKDGGYYWVDATITPVLGIDGKPIKYIGVRFDVTELVRKENEIQQQLEEMKATEEQLRQNMEELRATEEDMKRNRTELEGQQGALNNAAIVSETDLRGHITYINEKFCEIAQYTKEELLGKNHNIVRHPDMPKEAFEQLWKTISSGKVWHGRVKNRKKDGDYYWVEATMTPVMGPNGKPIKYIGVRFDITEQVKQEELIRKQLIEMKSTEEQLRQSMEELKATEEEMKRNQVELEGQQNALNNAAIVSETDLRGYITYINEKFCEIAQYTKEELLGKNHNIVRHPDMPKEAFEQLWKTISSGKIWRGRVKNLKKNGDFYWVEATISPVMGPNGKPIKYIGVRFDITEQVKQEELIRKQLIEMQSTEEQLRQSMEELKATEEEMKRNQVELEGQQNALNNAAIVSETDLRGYITYINDTFCKICGYSKEELLGANHNIVRHPDMPKEAFEHLWQTISSGKVWKGRVKNKKKDGGFYWVDATITPVMGVNNKPIKYIGVRFDITEQVIQEENFKRQLEEFRNMNK